MHSKSCRNATLSCPEAPCEKAGRLHLGPSGPSLQSLLFPERELGRLKYSPSRVWCDENHPENAPIFKVQALTFYATITIQRMIHRKTANDSTVWCSIPSHSH